MLKGWVAMDFEGVDATAQVSLKPLWKYRSVLSGEYNVTCMSFNPSNPVTLPPIPQFTPSFTPPLTLSFAFLIANLFTLNSFFIHFFIFSFILQRIHAFVFISNMSVEYSVTPQ